MYTHQHFQSTVTVNNLMDIPGEILALLIIVLYPIGIFIDEMADKILLNWSEKIRKRTISERSIAVSDQDKIKVSYLFSQNLDERLKDYFSYVRTRIRIARSTALNFLLITLSLEVFLITRLHVDTYTIIIVTIIGVTLTILAMLSWYFFTTAFINKTIDQLRLKSLIS